MIDSMSLPKTLAIVPLKRPPAAAVDVPGSKSITNRALVLAALASHAVSYRLTNILRSEDTEVMATALQTLGFEIALDWDQASAHFLPNRTSRIIPATSAELFAANSGTSMRFLTALVGLGQGRYQLDGVPRMRERPIEDLLAGLRQGGVSAWSKGGNGCPPVVVEAQGWRGGRMRLKGDVSSQFVSALLMAAPFAQSDVTIELTGPLVSEPYVSMTVEMMRQWCFDVDVAGAGCFRIPAPQRLAVSSEIQEYAVEPDASAASYFLAAAAITGGRVTVLGLPEQSLQGDIGFVDLLTEMGCRVERCSSGVTVHGRSLRGIDVDMNDISDTVMTLAAVACFAEGPTSIHNVAHIRHKETDRLTALATELRRIGAEVEEFVDGLKILPRPLHAAEIETYNDHRMAMSLALVGLRVPGIAIKNPACVAKTYPRFFADLEKLR
jgi:3-phosphoshikimate 1-carboxyvinyltransferase